MPKNNNDDFIKASNEDVDTEANAKNISLESSASEAKSEIITNKKTVAKAGKRSNKSLKEIEEKEKKEVRKADTKVTEEIAAKPKAIQISTRSKLERRGKNYRKLVEQIDKHNNYSVDEAFDLVIKTSPTKFDATVELHVRLGVDPKQAEQNIRGTVILPSGTGKTIRVAVFADEEELEAAKKAGADIAMTDEFLQQLDKALTNFDVLIVTPAQMPKLSKYARFLGPKGLMPNPKNGTVTTNVSKTVKELKAGRVEYKIDSNSIIHLGIGKVSFGKAKLLDNFNSAIASIKSNKPAAFKGSFVKSIFITTSMGPSIKLENNLLP